MESVKNRRQSLDKLRQRLYTVAFLLALVGAVFALVIGETTGSGSPFTRNLLVGVILFEVLAVVLVRRPKFLRLIEELTYLVLSAVMASVLLYSLYLAESPAVLRTSLLSYYLWLPTVYVLLFFLYSSRGALIRSAGLFVLLFLISLPHILFSTGPTDLFEGFDTLGHHFVSTASIITLLYFFTRVKDRLIEAQAAVSEITVLSETDALTGLPNRRRIYNVLEQEMDRARRYGGPLSLVLFDIDDFKKVNDTLGHDAGDAVLTEISDLLGRCRRSTDQLGRWGGEEFVLVAPETDREEAVRLAERLRTVVEDHHFEAAGKLTASFGVTVFHEEDDLASLVKKADVNLYTAKSRGKNRVEG